jgi:hypothetical protein
VAQICGKFGDYPSIPTQPHYVTSSIGAEVFPAFANAIDAVIPAITNENVTGIGLLCQELGHGRLSATVSEFLSQHSSPVDRACHDVAPLAHLTAQSSQGIALLLAVAVKSHSERSDFLGRR